MLWVAQDCLELVRVGFDSITFVLVWFGSDWLGLVRVGLVWFPSGWFGLVLSGSDWFQTMVPIVFVRIGSGLFRIGLDR